MALPYLIKHIYNNGSEEVIRRGKKIHLSGNVEMLEYDELLNTVVFRVRDDSYSTYYKVHIHNFKDPEHLSLRCSCPYNLSEICRHKAAALFQLQEMLDKNLLGDRNASYDQSHTIVKLRQLDLRSIKMLTSQDNFEQAEDFLRSHKITILEAKDERVIGDLEQDGLHYKIVIQKNEERNFDTGCTCNSETEHPLCVHKTALFLQLLNTYGANYFDSIRNWNNEKNKLLSLYGYSLKDDLKGKFEFNYINGKPYLKVLDHSIKRLDQPIETEKEEVAPKGFDWEKLGLHKETLSDGNNGYESFDGEEVLKKSEKKLGIVINYNTKNYPFVEIIGISGVATEDFSKFKGEIEPIDFSHFINLSLFSRDDQEILQIIKKIQHQEVRKYISRNSPFAGGWENIIDQENKPANLSQETRTLINEYLLPKFKKLFSAIAESNFTYLIKDGEKISKSTLRQATIETDYLEPEFLISKNQENIEMDCSVKLPIMEINIADNESRSPLLIVYRDRIFTWKNKECLAAIEAFQQNGNHLINQEHWSEEMEKKIIPLSRKFEVKFRNINKKEFRDLKPDGRINLKEKGEYLLFEPSFIYLGYDVNPEEKERLVRNDEGGLIIIYRNLAVERDFVQKIENLHSGLIRINEGQTLALKGNEVLKNNWFFLFMDAVREMNIKVTGFEALQHFRFNTTKPSTKIYISSHTDWFDAKVEVSFNGQKVSVEDIKKALNNKQQYVQLPDGSLGILPEEWIQKYALLFSIGEGKASNIRLSKYHFSVIEELYNQRDEEEIFVNLEEKYENLKEHHSIEEIVPPITLSEILRPYQISGFQWLNYLRQVGWGGILADDMGLGKTIQALTYLLYLKKTQGHLRAMVICPTTLMFNWQHEIEKFTPDLTFYIHHGGSRNIETIMNDNINVTITTYGTLRSDIKKFMNIEFNYIVLDESQAIKNPNSKIAKAVCLLKAESRVCMSGTPLQNNTFDIFAQMNFLNPGMLGSVEFFKQEFAIPIDKFGERDQKVHLRKLLYPFILRRTKEQVAKDLPEKQEIILFCEMGDEQRKIYESIRNEYRGKILGKVDSIGIHKSQLTILQGLIRLRQVCDSPSIIHESEEFPNVSVKLDEIGRELTENISNHKALVFSQFLGMLALIRQKLDQLGVSYEYFDGKTSAIERERAITNFQNNDEKRVFLISLKAGGVGLNLTAADYVYIVDPWWNPAVEQQAIDRTHRIGQTKNILAYRMICRNTVEDKILKLQDKKRELAKDLITSDEGFIKSLTREDVEYLFSE